MGGVRNGAAEEDWLWDLKPRGGSHAWLGPCGFGVLPFAHGLGRRRDFAGKERGERTLAGGP